MPIECSGVVGITFSFLILRPSFCTPIMIESKVGNSYIYRVSSVVLTRCSGDVWKGVKEMRKKERERKGRERKGSHGKEKDKMESKRKEG